MLGRRDQPMNFFDLETFSRMIPKGYRLVLIKKHVDFSFVEEGTARYYHPGLARPGFPSEVLFRILFLGAWANLSDSR